MPPGIKCRFELERNPDQLIFLVPQTDTKHYKLKILTINLLVPVAQMSSSIYNELSLLLAKKEEPKSVTYHFRRIEIKTFTIPSNQMVYLAILCFIKPFFLKLLFPFITKGFLTLNLIAK